MQAPLAEKGSHESALLQKGQNLRRNSAAKIDAAEGQKFEGQIRRLGAIDFSKNLQRPATACFLAVEGGLAYNCGIISCTHSLCQPLRFGRRIVFQQKAINIMQTWTGEDTFKAGVPEFA